MEDGPIRVGDAEILAILDVERIDWPHRLGVVFPDVPAAAWEPYRRRHPGAFGDGEGVWRLPVVCFCVRDRGRTVLVDCGCGPASLPLPGRLGVTGRLVERLAAAGVPPEAVDTVLLTHLHPDHVGGALAHGAGGGPAFPRARYLVHREELGTWRRPEVQAAFPMPFFDDLVAPLERLGVLEPIGDGHPVAPGITAIRTPGHTPGSVSALVDSGGGRALVWGDAFAHVAHVSEPDWRFIRDMDHEAAAATRRRLLDLVAGRGVVVGAAHLPDRGLGLVEVIEGRRIWRAL